MDLLVVRHADAGSARVWAATGQPDDLRPLSDRGRQQMRTAALAFRELVPGCDLVATSPLRRAIETAEILCAAYGVTGPVTTPALTPDSDLADFEEWASQFDETDCVAVVGHEPHLSALATWLMTGMLESRITLKKGAACLIEFIGPAKPGAGTLRWLLGPRQLTRIVEGVEAGPAADD